MNDLIAKGRKRTILLAISVLLVSLNTIYYYHYVRPEIDTKKLIQQLVRFSLTIGLMYAIFIGKKWARIVGVILFSLGSLGAIAGLLNTQIPLSIKYHSQ